MGINCRTEKGTRDFHACIQGKPPSGSWPYCPQHSALRCILTDTLKKLRLPRACLLIPWRASWSGSLGVPRYSCSTSCFLVSIIVVAYVQLTSSCRKKQSMIKVRRVFVAYKQLHDSYYLSTYYCPSSYPTTPCGPVSRAPCTHAASCTHAT